MNSGNYPSQYSDTTQYSGYGQSQSQPQTNNFQQSAYQQQQQQQYQQQQFPQYSQGGGYSQGGQQYGGQQMPLNIDPLNINPLEAAKAISQAGTYWQGGQQFFQQRMGWLQGASYYFDVDLPYVRNKLLILMTPFLRRWTYVRAPEQIQGGNKYRPPRADDNAPDLYIPFMAMFTYCVMAAGHSLLEGEFKPDIMYPLVWYACMGWLVHFGVLRVILWMFHLPQGVPTLEIVALSGYPFLMISLTVMAQWIGGKIAWWGVGVYGAICMGTFLLRSVKRIIYSEIGTSYGIVDATKYNVPLFGLMAFQFLFLFWMAWNV
eukprot:TRINITY_DN1715_c1_g1_i2.p2 TRINITY_DN1715_c1_g1~~TRINITY_DN1715_c1_g1_i2.p2  ORF type:complete len:318 (+),score=41.03 TRINITY_DN1715_c1_g1_i2:222-1175(+)